jgi:hypothetical protein
VVSILLNIASTTAVSTMTQGEPSSAVFVLSKIMGRQIVQPNGSDVVYTAMTVTPAPAAILLLQELFKDSHDPSVIRVLDVGVHDRLSIVLSL